MTLLSSARPRNGSSAVRASWLAPLAVSAVLVLPGCQWLNGLNGNSGDNAISSTGSATSATTTSAIANLPPAATPPSVAIAPSAVPAPEPEPAPAGNGLTMAPGLYDCELSRTVRVQSISQDGQTLVMHWAGKDHSLTAVRARSGALRYEDASSGLTWITIVGKSLLLDLKNGQQLANECKLAADQNADKAPPVAEKPAARTRKKSVAKKS